MRLLIVSVASALLLACSPPPQAPEQSAAPAAATGEVAVVVTAPQPGARITSPFVVEGTGPGDWFFEAQFPARIVDAQGATIAEAPAMSQNEYITEAPAPFRAELTFSVSQDTPATLVLQEDMPADNAHPREVSVPVVLVPAN